jgi:ABC-type uncharacterized transport system auxiliary subunit
MNRLVKFVALFAGLAAGCTTARAPRYYFLPATPVSVQPGVTPFPVTILVGRVNAPRVLRDDRIIYGMTDVEIGIDDYHRWAETPPEMLEQRVVTRLRSSGQYKAVQRLSSSARGDYVLRGHLFALNEMDDASGIKARFSFQLELFDPKVGAVVWSEKYTHDEPVDKKSVTAVVQALQKNVTAGLDQLAGSLAQYFALKQTH